MDLALFEISELTQCETIIENGLQTFVDVGEALATIRDKRLYRESHSTFEDYCRERWRITPQHGRRLIQSADVVRNVTMEPIGSILPQTESQARPLTKLDNPDQQREAWQQAVETAPNGKVTASHVKNIVSAMKPKQNYKGDPGLSGPMDRCQTPTYAFAPVSKYLNSDWLIWEPARGEGYLSEAIHGNGFGIVESDILTGQNFFEYKPDNWDCLVTNPPFSIKYKWLERCYELGKPFALLLPVETLGAATAQRLFVDYGLELILMDKRVNFKMPNKGWDGTGAQFPVAWFTWGLNIGQSIVYTKATW